MKLKAFNIKYDLEGSVPPHQVKEVLSTLPKEVFVETLVTDADNEALEELISDEITDKTGFCHKGFEWNIVDEDDNLKNLLKDCNNLLIDNSALWAVMFAMGIVHQTDRIYPEIKKIKDKSDKLRVQIEKLLKENENV